MKDKEQTQNQSEIEYKPALPCIGCDHPTEGQTPPRIES